MKLEEDAGQRSLLILSEETISDGSEEEFSAWGSPGRGYMAHIRL